MLIFDTMPGGIHGMKSMADGKQYDSKSRYYRSLKDHGCVIVGNDSSHTTNRRGFSIQEGPTSDDVVGDIKKSIEQLNSLSETERANMMRDKPDPVGGFEVD